MSLTKGAYITYTKKRAYTCSDTLYKEKAGRIRQKSEPPSFISKPRILVMSYDSFVAYNVANS